MNPHPLPLVEQGKYGWCGKNGSSLTNTYLKKDGLANPHVHVHTVETTWTVCHKPIVRVGTKKGSYPLPKNNMWEEDIDESQEDIDESQEDTDEDTAQDTDHTCTNYHAFDRGGSQENVLDRDGTNGWMKIADRSFLRGKKMQIVPTKLKFVLDRNQDTTQTNNWTTNGWRECSPELYVWLTRGKYYAKAFHDMVHDMYDTLEAELHASGRGGYRKISANRTVLGWEDYPPGLNVWLKVGEHYTGDNLRMREEYVQNKKELIYDKCRNNNTTGLLMRHPEEETTKQNWYTKKQKSNKTRNRYHKKDRNWGVREEEHKQKKDGKKLHAHVYKIPDDITSAYIGYKCPHPARAAGNLEQDPGDQKERETRPGFAWTKKIIPVLLAERSQVILEDGDSKWTTQNNIAPRRSTNSPVQSPSERYTAQRRTEADRKQEAMPASNIVGVLVDVGVWMLGIILVTLIGITKEGNWMIYTGIRRSRKWRVVTTVIIVGMTVGLTAGSGLQIHNEQQQVMADSSPIVPICLPLVSPFV